MALNVFIHKISIHFYPSFSKIFILLKVILRYIYIFKYECSICPAPFVESLLLILHCSGIVRGSLRLPSQNTITVCLIRTEILCFSVLEATSPKSSCQEDQVPSQIYCRDSSLPLSSLWWFAGNLWHFSMQQQHFSLCLLIIRFSPNKSVLRCPSSYKDTSNTGLRAHPITLRLESEIVSHSAVSDSLWTRGL